MAGDAWKSGRPVACDNDERKCVKHGGIHRSGARCLNLLRRAAGQALVEMESYFPMPRRGEDGLDQLRFFCRLKQRCRQPG